MWKHKKHKKDKQEEKKSPFGSLFGSNRKVAKQDRWIRTEGGFIDRTSGQQMTRGQKKMAFGR